MKKVLWGLRLAIILFGGVLIYEQLQLQKANRQSIAVTNVKPQASAGLITPLAGYDTAPLSATWAGASVTKKVQAAEIWRQVKGPAILDTPERLHVLTSPVCQRVKTDLSHDTWTWRHLTRVYQDSHADPEGQVVYFENHDRTVTLTTAVPVTWEANRELTAGNYRLTAHLGQRTLTPERTLPPQQAAILLALTRRIG